MDRPTILNNLFALIDSGKEENLEMALQLSVNLADEWKWIHVMLQSRKRLPTGCRSWYDAYAKAVKYDLERIRFSVLADGKVDDQTYTMTEIHQGVALELHWLLFRQEFFELKNETRRMEFDFQRNYFAPIQNQDRAKLMPIELLDKITNLLPR